MSSRYNHLIAVCLTVLARLALADQGVAVLDEIIFEKIASRYQVCLLKLDKSYPYGEKHDQYTLFGKEQNVLTEELLVADIHIKNYGDYENAGLLKKYKMTHDDLPAIMLFKNGDFNKFIQYPKDSEVTVANLKNFVRKNTHFYIGLSGCIKEFDLMAEEFMAKFNRNEFSEVDKLIEKGTQMIEEFSEEKVGFMNNFVFSPK